MEKMASGVPRKPSPTFPRQMRRHRVLRPAGLLCLLLASCMGGSSVTMPGGTPLAGTDDARCQGESALSVSPDGRWLLYESRKGDAFAPVFVFLDLSDGGSGGRHPTTLSPKAAELATEGRGPQLPACWAADSGTAFFPGQRGWFAVAVGSGERTLRPVPEPDCRHPGAALQPAGARVIQDSPTELRIVGAGGAVLATHGVDAPAVDRVAADRLRSSPDGRWLAYVVTAFRGSFTAPPRGYVVPTGPVPDQVDRAPELLVAPLYGAPVWSPDGALFACTGRPDAPGAGPRILRWNLGANEPNRSSP